MTQTPPSSASSKAFTRFLIRFALVEGAVLVAIMLAMVFDLIDVALMVPLVFVAAVLGAAVLTWRVLAMQKQRQNETASSAHLPGSTAEHGTDSGGLGSLGQKDPMAKYRDPNR